MPEKNKKNKSNIVPLRTYKTDTSAYIKKEGVSLLDIAAAEAGKKRGSGFGNRKTVQQNNTKKIILLTLILLMSVGLAATAGFLFFKQKKEDKPMVVVLPESPIIPDETIEITTSEIFNISNIAVSPNKFFYFPVIEEFNGFKRLISVREFFGVMEVIPSYGMIDSLKGEFMLSVFRLTQKSPILILEVRSYENAFASMLKWEKKIIYDLAEILNINNVESLKIDFYDKEIKNKDSRVAKDENGNIVFLYSFINREYLVITTSEEAVKEVFKRFTVSKFLNK